MSAPVEAASGEVVDRNTGEIVVVCTEDEARALTDRIRSAAEAVWELLLEAHDRQAWKALGYESFSDYATTEFGMSKVHAYRLVSQGQVVQAIEEASGVTRGLLDVPERVARDVKPNLKSVTERVTHETKNVTEETERARLAEQVLAEERAKAEAARKQRDADNAAIRDLNEKYQPDGFDPAENERLVTERGAFARLCRDLSKLPDPEHFIDQQRADLRERHITYAEGAYEWLDAFLLMWRDQ